MRSIIAHEKQHLSYVDDGTSGGGKEIPQNSTIEELDSLGATFDFIDFWLRCFDQKYQARSNTYSEAIQDWFKKILVQLPKPLIHKEKISIIIKCYWR